jgi:hypothetical protein
MTKELFRKIGQALQEDLDTRVDAVERFDGDPENAVNEHVAELSDENGASILYGFEATDIRTRDAAMWPTQIGYPVVVIILKRRTKEGMAADAEAVDDLMDLVLDTFSVYKAGRGVSFFGCRAIIPQPVNMTLSDLDGNWIGRGIPFLFTLTHEPAT